MQLVRYTAGGAPEWDVRRNDDVVPLSDLREDVIVQNLNNPGFLIIVKDAMDAAKDQSVSIEDVELLASVSRPGRIVCVGLSYHDHAEGQGEEIPERSFPFGRIGTFVANPGDPIVHPAATDEVDYEAEFGVVIGQTAKNVDAEDVFDYVAGYTAINDVGDRDAQFDGGQFFRDKNYDTLAPTGPTFIPEGDVGSYDLDIACRVNGETRQESSTSEFIFGVDEVVKYISGITTPRSGDVISTDTFGDIGIFHDPPELFGPGDSVDVEIEGIGTLINPIISERDE